MWSSKFGLLSSQKFVYYGIVCRLGQIILGNLSLILLDYHCFDPGQICWTLFCLTRCVSTMVLLSKSELTVDHFQRWTHSNDDYGNTLIRNHFQKERSSLASFQNCKQSYSSVVVEASLLKVSARGNKTHSYDNSKVNTNLIEAKRGKTFFSGGEIKISKSHQFSKLLSHSFLFCFVLFLGGGVCLFLCLLLLLFTLAIAPTGALVQYYSSIILISILRNRTMATSII